MVWDVDEAIEELDEFRGQLGSRLLAAKKQMKPTAPAFRGSHWFVNMRVTALLMGRSVRLHYRRS